MIEFGCKNCGQKLRIQDQHSGKRVKCPKCGSIGVVPDNSTKIKFHCETCGQSISVAQIHAGKKGKCPKCKNPVVVPFPKGPRGPTEPDLSVPSGIDGDQYEEESDVSEEGSGTDRRLIFVISGVAAIVVVGLIILITVVLPSGSRPVEKPLIATPESNVKPNREPEKRGMATVEPVEATPLPKLGDIVTNSIGMKLVYISGGSFMMGTPLTERGRRMYEGPQHQVRISESFWMSQTEVTQGQYKSVMNAHPWSGKPGVQESDNNAASRVIWEEAAAFCRKLSQQEGKTYRLPTEAEWEYACRAGTATRFSFGDSDSSLDDYAWFRHSGSNVTQGYAHPVGQKKPNPWGLYDMHGSVSEWCSDYFDRDYYSNSRSVDPNGPPTGVARCLRGGSWSTTEDNLRCSSRAGCDPDERGNTIGFRVVCSQSNQPPGSHVEPDQVTPRQDVGETGLRHQPVASEKKQTIVPHRAEPGQPTTDGATQQRNKRMAELIAKLKDQRANDSVRRGVARNLDKTAPPFTLKDLNGKQVSLSDFKGKVVLLDFWATWCGPCRRVIPHLEALHKKYKDQGLVIIGMNHERDHEKVRAFAKEQMSYIVLLDADEQFKEYSIRGIPTAFYIDRDGKICYREVGYGPGAEVEAERKVSELLTIKNDVTTQAGELDQLIGQLKRTSPRTRARAASSLGKLGDKRAIESLVVALKDNYASVRLSAAEALTQLDWQPTTDLQRAYYLVALQKWTEAVNLGPSAVEPLLVALNVRISGPEDAAVYQSAREALTKIGSVAVEPAIAALKDKDTRLHSSAVRALGILRDKRAVEPLIAALKYNDTVVRRSAASELRVLGDKHAVEPLIEVLKDTDAAVRRSAATALGELGDKRAVEPLIAALKDRDKYMRASAAFALGLLGDERAVEPLIALMSDTDRDMRWSLGSALSRLAKNGSADRLAELLDDPDMNVRSLALEALAKAGDERAFEPLILELKDNNVEIRRSAASILGTLGDKRAVEPLIAALKDQDAQVRDFAAGALGQLGDERAVEPLREALRGDGNKVSFSVAFALAQLLDDERAVEPLLAAIPDSGMMGIALMPMLIKIGPPAVEPLIVALKDENKSVRYIAAHVLFQLDDKRAVEPVITFLKSQSEELREPGARALEETESSTIEYLIELLKHKEMFYVRSSAAWALGWLGDKRAVEPLVAALGKAGVVGNPYVARVQAAIALGRLGDKRAIEPLIDILKRNAINSDELKQAENAGLTQMRSMQVQSWQRSSAKILDALQKIGPPAVEPLVDVLKDENAYMRSFAAEALGELGDKGSIEALVKALKDEDKQVQKSAKEALSKLGWQLGTDVE